MSAATAREGEMMDLEDLERQSEVMTIRRWQDATITVDRWPKVVRFDAHLIRTSDPSHLRRDDDVITMHVANGRAVYRVAGESILTMTVVARLESCWLQEVGP